MSIINEALKKLQNQISHSQIGTGENQNPGASAPLTAAQQAGFEPVPSLYSSTPSAPQKNTERATGSRLILILGLLCLLTALFAPIVNKQSVMTMLWAKIPQKPKTFKTQPTPAPAVNIAPIQEEKKQEPITQIIKKFTPAASKPAASSPSRLIINGIMTRGDQNLALIDGQVYEEGEEVEGVKLIKITPKGVTVLEDGTEHFVKVMGQ